MNDFIVCHNDDEVNKNCSMFGNEFYILTDEDIAELLKGNTLTTMINDEYGIFIRMKKE